MIFTQSADEGSRLITGDVYGNSFPETVSYRTIADLCQKKYRVYLKQTVHSMLDDDEEDESSPGGGRRHNHVVNATLCSKGLAVNTMYEWVPPLCILGIQRLEVEVQEAACEYAAGMVDHGENGDFQGENGEEKLKRLNVKQQLVSELHRRIERENPSSLSAMTSALKRALLVSVASEFLVGYNIGVINSPNIMAIWTGGETLSWSWMVATMPAGAVLGSLLALPVADKYGRRFCLVLATWSYLLGGILQSLAMALSGTRQEHLVFIALSSRFLIGLASGAVSLLVPLFLGEVSPPNMRGKLGTLLQLANVLGLLFSFCLTYVMARPLLDSLRLIRTKNTYVLGVTAWVALIQLIMCRRLVQSPLWLLRQDSKSIEARKVVATLRECANDAMVEEEILHLICTCRAQRSNIVNTTDGGCLTTSTGLKDILASSRPRNFLICCFVLQMAQQLSGINAVFSYSSTFIFHDILIHPLAGTALVGMANCMAAILAVWFVIEPAGRRNLLLWSSGGMMACCAMVVLVRLGLFVGHESNVTLTSVNLYVVFYEIGLGPIPWILVVEFFHPRHVTSAFAASCQLNWLFHFLVTLLLPTMATDLGASFFCFDIILSLTFLYILANLRDTRGLTSRTLHMNLTKGDSVRSLHKAPGDISRLTVTRQSMMVQPDVYYREGSLGGLA